MKRPKVDRASFEAQFHNHHHYTEMETPDPEWWEVDQHHRPAHATGGAVAFSRPAKGGTTAERPIVGQAFKTISKGGRK